MLELVIMSVVGVALAATLAMFWATTRVAPTDSAIYKIKDAAPK